MFRKKWFRVLALSLAIVLVLLALFVAAFVVNPFEGSLADMRGVVPRDVDFFLRKRNLAQDFPSGRFPEPVFWAELTASEAWRQFQTGPIAQDLRQKGIERSIGELRDALRLVHDQSRGFVDVVKDALGREVEIAGKFKNGRSEDTEWCAYLRVSTSLVAACNLLQYGFVQDMVKKGGTNVRPDGDMLLFEPQGGKPIWLARYKDCVFAGNSKEFVARSFRLASLPDGESLGRSADYVDGVESRLIDWEKRTKVGLANAVEVYLRPDQADTVLKLADRWPSEKAQDDMNERVLAKFLNLKGWRFLTGGLIFEDKSLSLLAKVDLDHNKHVGIQSEFFKAEAQDRKLWLDPFLTLVPADACAFAALRMPVGAFLREMFEALEPAMRDELNNAARKTGKYPGGIPELIESVSLSFLPRTGFVFRKNVPDKDIPVAEPSAVPQIAWVFWTQDNAKQPIKAFIETLYQHVDTFRLKAYQLSMTNDRKGDAAGEFANPQIPGTGEFAMILFDRFFILSNSGPLIREMFTARFEPSRSILATTAFKRLDGDGEIPSLVNGFVYVQGQPLEKVLEGYQLAFEASQTAPDPSWMESNRQIFEAEVFRQRYAGRYGSIAALDRATKTAFDKDVDAYMDEQWRKRGKNFGEGSRASLRQAVAVARMFSAACMTLNFDKSWMKLAGRALVEYR